MKVRKGYEIEAVLGCAVNSIGYVRKHRAALAEKEHEAARGEQIGTQITW